jgi:hypothetical protein
MGGDAAAFPAGAVASVAAAGRDGVGAGGGSPPVGWAVPIRTTCPPPEAITSVEEKKGRGEGGANIRRGGKNAHGRRTRWGRSIWFCWIILHPSSVVWLGLSIQIVL